MKRITNRMNRQRLKKTFHIAQSAETIDGAISKCFLHLAYRVTSAESSPVCYLGSLRSLRTDSIPSVSAMKPR